MVDSNGIRQQLDRADRNDACDQGEQGAPQAQQPAKKKSDLGVRFAAGFVYVAISVICVGLSTVSTVVYLAAVSGICAFEFYRMMHVDAKIVNDAIGILAAVCYPLAVYIHGAFGALLVSLVFLVALSIWYVFFPKARIMDVCLSFFGAAYMGLLLSCLIPLRQSLNQPWGGVLLVILLASVWFNDAGAYLVGSKIGKHKMAPTISPKKSWEGFAGGLVVSIIFWCLMTFIPGVNMNFAQAALFGILVGAMSILGDLVESRIKRNVGVKDSGNIMPGHGGLFDRSDSLFTASVTATFLLYVGGCVPIVF